MRRLEWYDEKFASILARLEEHDKKFAEIAEKIKMLRDDFKKLGLRTEVTIGSARCYMKGCGMKYMILFSS